jgi:hypothetical protein
MPIQVYGVLVHAVFDTELSRVRAELRKLYMLSTVSPHPVQSLIRVRTSRCRCQSSCRRSRFSGLGT